jgi:hypothetical protein
VAVGDLNQTPSIAAAPEMLVRLFTKLDGGAFGYALTEDGSSCIQLGTHGSLTSVCGPVCVHALSLHGYELPVDSKAV